MEIYGFVCHPNITLDFFHLEESSVNNANIFTNRYIPSLNNNSKVLITFDSNNNCEGVSESALGYSFSAYREESGTNELKYLTKINDGALSLIDYNIANQKEYTYYIFKEDDNTISAANISDPVEACWWEWSITGITKASYNTEEYTVNSNDIWIFSLNIESAEKIQNFNKVEYRNLTKFPKISQGNLNYTTGSLTCLIGEIRNNNYVDTVELLNAWNDFCTNGQLKLLKDRKGNKMIVDIMSSSTKTYDETKEQADVLTFSWAQLKDSDDMTIIGE